MNLFYTADNNFAPQLGAALCSVCENNREAPSIHFYIGALDIAPDNQDKLRHLAEGYGREITFISLSNLSELIGFDFDTSGWNPVIAARLLIGQLLPEEVDRVLYLDGDTIVNGSLAELWDTDLQGRAVGASIEPTVNRARKEALGLGRLHYFNSGVLLIDLKRWRQEGTGERILSYYREHNGGLVANDQDAINGALAGEIHPLSPKYNFYNIFWYYPYRVLRRLEAPAPYFSEAEFRDALEHPVILHYLGEDRPWRRGNTHRYASVYQHYLSLTPWKGAAMEEGWQTYFLCYKLFLTVLKPFPMLRYRIMDRLIPLFIRHRARQRTKRA